MSNMFRYRCCSVICSVQVFTRGVFYGQPFDWWSLSCTPVLRIFFFFFCLHTLSSCTHYLAALLTTVVVEEKIWKTWVLWVTSRTYPEKWIVTCVGYARVTSAVHFCILAPAQRRCVFSCWWMGHTANKQYLQPSVRSGVNAGDIVQHRGIYPEA